MRQCQKSILMPQYGFLASSCDCANMDSVKLKILPSVKVVRDPCQKITLLLLKSKIVRVIVPESCF